MSLPTNIASPTTYTGGISAYKVSESCPGWDDARTLNSVRGHESGQVAECRHFVLKMCLAISQRMRPADAGLSPGHTGSDSRAAARISECPLRWLQVLP